MSEDDMSQERGGFYRGPTENTYYEPPSDGGGGRGPGGGEPDRLRNPNTPAGGRPFMEVHNEIRDVYRLLRDPANSEGRIDALKRQANGLQSERQALLREADGHEYLEGVKVIAREAARELVQDLASGDSQAWSKFYNRLDTGGANEEQQLVGSQDPDAPVQYRDKYRGMARAALQGMKAQAQFVKASRTPGISSEVLQKFGFDEEAQGFVPFEFADAGDELVEALRLDENLAQRAAPAQVEQPQPGAAPQPAVPDAYAARLVQLSEEQNRLAREALRTTDAPIETQYEYLVDFERTGEQKPEARISARIFEYAEKPLVVERLILAQVRAQKQAISEMRGVTEVSSPLNLEQLQRLTDYGRTTEAMGLHLLALKNPELLHQHLNGGENGRNYFRQIGGKDLYKMAEDRKLDGRHYEMYRQGIRMYLTDRFEISEEEAQISEHIAKNMIDIGYIPEFVDQGHQLKLGSIKNVFAFYLTNPRARALDKAGKGQVWPPNELGKWFRHHFAPGEKLGFLHRMKPKVRFEGSRRIPLVGEPVEDDIPIPETLVKSAYHGFRQDGPRRGREKVTMFDRLEKIGEDVVTGRMPRDAKARLDWVNSGISEQPFDLYMIDQQVPASGINEILGSRDPRSVVEKLNKNWEQIGDDVRKLKTDTDGRLRKTLVYLAEQVDFVNDRDPSASGKKFRLNWLQGAHKRATFRPNKNPAQIALYWADFHRLHPNYLD